MAQFAKVAALALAVLGAMAVGACQTTAADTPQPGLAFAESSCGGCHAVERGGDSPNPLAPPFVSIVNQPGLSGETLGTWLRDAHNYPAQMQFSLSEDDVDKLVAYMVTLRDPNYRPPI